MRKTSLEPAFITHSPSQFWDNSSFARIPRPLAVFPVFSHAFSARLAGEVRHRHQRPVLQQPYRHNHTNTTDLMRRDAMTIPSTEVDSNEEKKTRQEQPSRHSRRMIVDGRTKEVKCRRKPK
jgi:hypothetical protein